MERICTLCKADVVDQPEQSSVRNITGGVCSSCNRLFNTSCSAATLKALADAIDAPVLVMQSEPRQVYTANGKALELFKKEPDRIEKHRGGQVFDCVYAFTEAGCGKDVHCQPCKIKNAIVETLTTGRTYTGVSALMDIRKSIGTSTYTLQVSTEKIGDMALVRIDRYEPVT
jgi:transcriptional regulator of aromatic amino acid metabolism